MEIKWWWWWTTAGKKKRNSFRENSKKKKKKKAEFRQLPIQAKARIGLHVRHHHAHVTIHITYPMLTRPVMTCPKSYKRALLKLFMLVFNNSNSNSNNNNNIIIFISLSSQAQHPPAFSTFLFSFKILLLLILPSSLLIRCSCFPSRTLTDYTPIDHTL